MFNQENKIAHAENALFEARFYRQPAEGMTVRVPNVVDRALIVLRNALRRPAARPQGQLFQRGAPAK